jgi:hypothetical protein
MDASRLLQLARSSRLMNPLETAPIRATGYPLESGLAFCRLVSGPAT